MKVLRTPDVRFEGLTEYPFAPNYVQISPELRMHYLDEGQHPTETLLLMHGEPTWSYLYRKMIPLFTAAGYRVIAPDLIGFGKSDKPTELTDYSYQNHVDWMSTFLQKIDLQNLTLVCQDWGGLIGLRLAAENQERFKRITVSNTFLPTGQGKPSDAFLAWQQYSQTAPVLNIGKIVNGGCAIPLSAEAIAAYDAPFPDEDYKAGARIFPALVPTSPQDPAVPANLKAWEVYKQWQKPFLTAFGDKDPITHGGDTFFQKVVLGAQNQPHITLQNAGHFCQEDQGEAWAKAIIDWMQASV